MPKLTYRGLADDEDEHEDWLRGYRERADANIYRFQGVSVEERFAGFKLMGFRPHGLFVPDDEAAALDLRKRVLAIGATQYRDEKEAEAMRMAAYARLQEETEIWAEQGMPGKWTGQQAVARSDARFRLVAYGRRGGKTTYAAAEALSIAKLRPRSWVWLAAPIAKLTGRAFDYVVNWCHDLGWADEKGYRERNQVQEKEIILPNGSRIEGISLENPLSAAGAAIDFAVIDEAAQITPDAWVRGILPPLIDRNGGALLISSYEGEGDFFSDKVLQVQREAERAKQLGFAYKPEWELFQAASYDVNFYAFPQGIHTKSLEDARKEMDVVDFMEQFGAKVAASREKVYIEFREPVHVGHYAFNPEHPVRLAADPSSGSNPYAILVIQDYGDYFIIIDELYEVGVKIEDYDPILRRRPWAANVESMVLDWHWPHDIIRWNELGWKAFGCQVHQVQESIPVVKTMFRNGQRYDRFYRAKLNFMLQKMGYEPDSDRLMPEDRLKEVLTEVEAGLTNDNLSHSDIDALKDCSRIFVDRKCVAFINEMKMYSYRKRRNLAANYHEEPRKYMDHLADALRYYAWTYHRFNANEDMPRLRSYMTLHQPMEDPDDVEIVPPEPPDVLMGRRWLEHHRERTYSKQRGYRSYLHWAS